MQLRPHVADKLLLSSGSEYERRVSYAFQQTPFGEDAASRVTIIDRHTFEFHPQDRIDEFLK